MTSLMEKIEDSSPLFVIPTVELINIAYALCEENTLRIVYCNSVFIEWFKIHQAGIHLDEVISSLNKEMLFKRIDKRGHFTLSKTTDSEDKKIPPLIEIKFQKTNWQNTSYIAVHALDMSSVLEKDMLIESHSKIMEATVAERTYELAGKNTALENAQNYINNELKIARNLQLEILPANFPPIAGCDGAALMIPATTMGGDFYDFIELPDGKIGLVMADVSGKGVPAAFFMAVARTNLRLVACGSSGPSECLRKTNDLLCTQNPMYLFVTIFYGVFDPVSGVLSYANGGHNPPIVRRADGTIVMLASLGDTALGIIEDANFQEHIHQFLPGDSLVLYTDGVTEAFNSEWQEHGEERMVNQVSKSGNGSAKNLVTAIFDSVIDFAGTAPQSDDIAITVLKWNPL